jgi:hypothetical protein
MPHGKQNIAHSHPHMLNPVLNVPAWQTGHVPPLGGWVEILTFVTSKKYVFNENLSLKFIIKKHVCILSNCKTAMVAFFLAHAEAADNPYRKAENAAQPST